MVKHPAKYNDKLIPVFMEFLEGNETILDPFAGTGKIFDLLLYYPHLKIHAIEIEPEWASMHPCTQVGNALDLPFSDEFFDVVITSAVFGNRMSDHHEARDGSKRNTYRHTLGRPLHPENSGQLQWGKKYRAFHKKAWREVHRALKPQGHFILNIKDHIRAGKRQLVTAWHIGHLITNGFHLIDHIRVDTPGNKQGNNYSLRIDYESVILFERR